jgi:hypothetical protein
MSFSVADVCIGETLLRGKNTAGSVVAGQVIDILPGVGFRILTDAGQKYMIWRDFCIVSEAAEAVEAVDVSSDYGYPDCEFWEANGIDPLYIATPYDYNASRVPAAPGNLLVLLLEARSRVETKGGASLRAWSRQLTESLSFLPSRSPGPILRTPPRPGSASPALCPGAPARPGRAEADADAEAETEDDEAEEEVDQEEVDQEEVDQEEDQEEVDQEEEQEEQEDEVVEEDVEDVEEEEEEEAGEAEVDNYQPKLINLLSSPNTVPIVVLLGWVVYLSFHNYCSCPCASRTGA